MSQFTINRISKSAASCGFQVGRSLEDRLHGLSDDELVQLHDLVARRIAKEASKQMTTTLDATEELNLKQLTTREREVLTLVASGYTRPEVAKALTISRNTAATHVANIYRKLDIESIAEATMLAFRGGIVS